MRGRDTEPRRGAPHLHPCASDAGSGGNRRDRDTSERGRMVAGRDYRGSGAAHALRQGGAVSGCRLARVPAKAGTSWLRWEAPAFAGAHYHQINPPPSARRIAAIRNTIRQKLRPPLLDESAPRMIPITMTGMAIQLPHPRNGMVEGMTITRLMSPNRKLSKLKTYTSSGFTAMEMRFQSTKESSFKKYRSNC